MDLGVRASFAFFVSIRHLQGSVKSPGFVLTTVTLRDDLRNDLSVSIETFCVFPNRKSDNAEFLSDKLTRIPPDHFC
jgi:hypothetical protein